MKDLHGSLQIINLKKKSTDSSNIHKLISFVTMTTLNTSKIIRSFNQLLLLLNYCVHSNNRTSLRQNFCGQWWCKHEAANYEDDYYEWMSAFLSAFCRLTFNAPMFCIWRHFSELVLDDQSIDFEILNDSVVMYKLNNLVVMVLLSLTFALIFVYCFYDILLLLLLLVFFYKKADVWFFQFKIKHWFLYYVP